MRLVVYWLVFFSIVVHSLSVPILYMLYKAFNVPKVYDHPVEVILLFKNEPLPNNSLVDLKRHSVLINNLFSVSNGLNNYEDSDNDSEPSPPREPMERIHRGELNSVS
ncbi:uncharacterized protein BDV17DRAFT_175683 [Aspergillus undulatus]|uniref:uncharacterized protein n=1 Tax=Aspergillus undulatus TaxID=1810928 RepID=UPI003CCDD71A